MYADIDERAKVGHIRNGAFQNHTGFQIRDVFHAIGKCGGFKFATRVAPRFFQFFENVLHRRQTETFIGKLVRIQFEHRIGAHQFLNGLLRGVQNFFHQSISFRVNAGSIERIFTVGDAHKTGALLKGFRP